MGLDVYIKEMDREAQYTGFIAKGEVGYFRDCYNDYSLANWLSRNIVKNARGSWGLAIFTERKDINTAKWRKDLLETARQWYEEAKKLRGKTTYVGYPQRKAIKLNKKDADAYIDWCKELLTFAEKLNEIKGTVIVSA